MLHRADLHHSSAGWLQKLHKLSASVAAHSIMIDTGSQP